MKVEKLTEKQFITKFEKKGFGLYRNNLAQRVVELEEELEAKEKANGYLRELIVEQETELEISMEHGDAFLQTIKALTTAYNLTQTKI